LDIVNEMGHYRPMKKLAPLSALAALALLAAPVQAALPVGATAPTFVAQGAMAGKPVTFDLAQALRKGPVVLYFFPAAFTPGCNIEAQMFAEAIPDFERAGATVIGVTQGNIDQLEDFSSKHCAGKFPVAAASDAMKRGYDVELKRPDGTSAGVTDRTTFVIAPNGRIVLSYSDLKPNEHITRSLAAVRALKQG
jgi:thioredoxin-dependent peroxiredoxin